MRNSFAFAAVAALSVAVMPTAASAQTFEKQHYNYSEWAKGRFSEAVTVTGPGKMIFLAGVGSEDENGKGGDILYKGDFTAQCKYAFDKIKRALEKNARRYREDGHLHDRRQISARFRQVPAGHVRNDADARAHATDHQPACVARHAGRNRRHRRRPIEIGESARAAPALRQRSGLQ